MAMGIIHCQICPQNATLVFSFVGMRMQEVIVGNQTVINISLLDETIGIDEVVAIGYGTLKKSDITSSIAQLTPENVIERGLSNIEHAMAGQMAGVQVQSSTGIPGSSMKINIRGIATISGGKNPLIVVDGFPTNSLIDINPNDIKSIDVLKDAAAGAIYGSRASNGVILVTTKRGTLGKPQFNANLTYGLQSLSKKVDLLNRDEFIDFITEIKPRLYDPKWDSDPQGFPDTDWQDETFRTAPMTNFDMSVSGGTENVAYRVSFQVLDQDGIAVETNYQKFNLRSNLDVKVNDKIKLGFDFSSGYETTNAHHALEGKDVEGSSGYTPGIIKLVLNLYPIQNPNSEWGPNATEFYPYIQDDFDVFMNPVARLKQEKHTTGSLTLNAGGFIEYEILKGLKYKSYLGTRFSDYRTNSFFPRISPNWPTAIGFSRDNRFNRNLVDNTINFEKTINEKHYFNVLAGLSYEKVTRENIYLRKSGWENESITVLAGGSFPTHADGTLYENALISYLGRFHYSFNDVYIFSASIRRDGASQFGPNKKWGIFPSASAAWKISDESFFDVSFISSLKLRSSIGKTGNNSLSDYAWQSASGVTNYIFGTNENPYKLFTVGSLSDRDIGWEETTTFDFGLDFGILGNRISGAFDYYIANTSNLLLSVPIPAITGSNSIFTNMGKMKNEGFEIELRSSVLRKDRFKWDMNINLTHNKNEVIKMGPTDAPIYGGQSGTAVITQVGSPFSSYFLLEVIGVLSSADIAAGYPRRGNQVAGDYKYADHNSDGKIDANDRVVLGHNNPDWMWGWTNRFSYGPFALNVLLQGVNGNHVFLNQGREMDSGRAVSNQLARWANRWRSDENPGDGMTPRANSTTAREFGSQWLYKGDFWRIRSVSLRYTLPETFLNSVNISQMSFYVSGENLFTQSEYPLWNPEINSDRHSGQGQGLDYGGFPLSRNFNVGVSVNF
jgi:TonB-dependent starch-binding outer membrane protein SusC